jgi:hypothetical protein
MAVTGFLLTMILAVTEAERVSLIAEAVLINWVSPRGN